MKTQLQKKEERVKMDKYKIWLMIFITGIMFLPVFPLNMIAYYGIRGHWIDGLYRSDFVYYGFPLIGIALIIGSSLWIAYSKSKTVEVEGK